MSDGGVHSIRAEFDRELEQLQSDFLRMGALAADLIHRSVEALKARDVRAAEQIIADDDQIDEMHVSIERRALQLIATQQPMATDLRTIAAVMFATLDMERLADHAEGIAKATRRLGAGVPISRLDDVGRMAAIVLEMLRGTLDAFVARDVALAERTALRDDEVDRLRSEGFQDLLRIMTHEPDVVPQAFDMLIVIQNLERAADHVTNIAERVIYMVTGELRELNV